jgi:hypothetical protein
VERQPILRKALGQHSRDALSILAVLKAENEVVGIPKRQLSARLVSWRSSRCRRAVCLHQRKASGTQPSIR